MRQRCERRESCTVLCSAGSLGLQWICLVLDELVQLFGGGGARHVIHHHVYRDMALSTMDILGMW